MRSWGSQATRYWASQWAMGIYARQAGPGRESTITFIGSVCSLESGLRQNMTVPSANEDGDGRAVNARRAWSPDTLQQMPLTLEAGAPRAARDGNHVTVLARPNSEELQRHVHDTALAPLAHGATAALEYFQHRGILGQHLGEQDLKLGAPCNRDQVTQQR